MIPVDVNATFNTIGDIKPLFVRLEDNQHELHTYKIQGIEYSKKDNRAGINTIIFACCIEWDGNLKQIKLTYNVGSHKWIIV